VIKFERTDENPGRSRPTREEHECDEDKLSTDYPREVNGTVVRVQEDRPSDLYNTERIPDLSSSLYILLSKKFYAKIGDNDFPLGSLGRADVALLP
jgi:hypothetical protein